MTTSPPTTTYTAITPAPFQRQARKFLRKHPDLRRRLSRLIDVLVRDPFDPMLALHETRHEARLYAVRLTYAHRVRVRIERRTIVFAAIGDHGAVYESDGTVLGGTA